MPVSFTVSQSALSPNTITVTDTSTSVPVSVTQRRIFVRDAYGVYLTGDGTINYTEWNYADSSIDLAILTQDTAANILMQLLDVNNVVVDEVNDNYPLSQFGKQFLFYLVQLQGLTPGIYQDSNYSGNLALFWTNIIAGDNAVIFGNDLAGAQNCYNRETEMRLNENKYF